MQVTEHHKEEVERRIVEAMIRGLEEGKLTTQESSTIAGIVLGRVDTIATQDAMAEFLTELSAKWPIFQPLMQIELGKVRSILEQKIAHDVLQLAHSGNIEEAIKLAKTMTEQH